MRNRRRIEDSVVVVTGASSGIGRAAALAVAERGASVVLAARTERSLKEVAEQCRAAGAQALVVPTDVSDEDAVLELARRADAEFGRIDVWINAAAVISYGEIAETPPEVFRQVIETNLFGDIYGARAVMPYFSKQRRGTLINIGSVWGTVTSPYVTPYVISKFGVRALSECLQEAMLLKPETHDIRVCTILPQSVDTPMFRHAANYIGRSIRPVPFVVDPNRVVKAILKSIEHPRRQRTVGWWGRALELSHGTTPWLFNRIVPYAMRYGAFGRDRADIGPGNVFEPMPEWNRVTGGWRQRRTRLLAGAAAGGIMAGAMALSRRLLNR